MRLHSFVLLAATFLLAYVGNTSKGAAADAPAQVRWDAEEQTKVATKRTSESMDEGNEARVVTTSSDSSLLPMLKRAGSSVRSNLGISDREVTHLKQQSLDLQQPLIRTSKRAENNDISVQMFLAASQWKTKAISKPATEKLFRALLSRDYSADDMFSALIKNDKTAHEIFFDEKWQLLKGYVEASTKHKDPAVLVETVVKGFGDEGKLLTTLVNAREDPRTKENALYLEDLLLAKWAGDEKKPEIVLRMLGLDQKVDLLASPATDIIVKYVGLFNKKNPDRQFSLIKALTDIHDDAEVMEYLLRCGFKKYDWATDLSRKLRNDLLHKWSKLNKSLGEVFDLLGLGTHGLGWYYHRLLLLREYRRTYQADHASAKLQSLATVLRGRYGNNDFAMRTAMLIRLQTHEKELIELDDVFQEWYGANIQVKDLDSILPSKYINFKIERRILAERYEAFYNKRHSSSPSPNFRSTSVSPNFRSTSVSHNFNYALEPRRA